MTHRLFAGIEPPLQLAESVGELRDALGDAPAWRWIPPERWHLTLLFMGEVPGDQLPNLLELFRVGLRSYAPFTLEFARFAYAPSSGRPRMIWARYKKQPTFGRMARRFAQLYDQIQPQQRRQNPIPHVTLARSRGEPAEPLAALPRSRVQARIRVEEIVLWESHLNPAGPRYEIIHRFPLNRAHARR